MVLNASFHLRSTSASSTVWRRLLSPLPLIDRHPPSAGLTANFSGLPVVLQWVMRRGHGAGEVFTLLECQLKYGGHSNPPG